MNIQSTLPKPANARTEPSVIITDETGKRAVSIQAGEFARDPDLFEQWGTVEDQIAKSVAAAVGPAMGAPVKIAALVIRNRSLFDRAVEGRMQGGNRCRLAAVTGTGARAVMSALGYGTASNVLKIGSEVLTVIADNQDSYVVLVSQETPPTLDRDRFFGRVADMADSAPARRDS